jgi:hypothetical protein
MSRILKPYMGWAGDSAEGAVLVFATTAREAKPIAFDLVRGWATDAEFVDVRVRRLRTHAAYLLTIADPAKLAAGLAHGLDDIPSCPGCELWGAPIVDGRCENCNDPAFDP